MLALALLSWLSSFLFVQQLHRQGGRVYVDSVLVFFLSRLYLALARRRRWSLRNLLGVVTAKPWWAVPRPLVEHPPMGPLVLHQIRRHRSPRKAALGCLPQRQVLHRHSPSRRHLPLSLPVEHTPPP